MASDQALRLQLEDLEQQRSLLQNHFLSIQVEGGLGPDFGDRILGLLDEGPSSKNTLGSRLEFSNEGSWKKILAVVASLAAILTLAIWLGPIISGTNPTIADIDSSSDSIDSSSDSTTSVVSNNSNNLTPDSSSQDLPDQLPQQTLDASDLEQMLAGQGEAPKFVSELYKKPFHYIITVDIVLAKDAVRRDALGQIFSKAEIFQDKPIVLNPELASKINEVQMVVSNEEDSDARLFFVRADVAQLTYLLDAIYINPKDFPDVRWNVAIDNPQARMLEAIARSTDQRFAIQDTFSAPISSESKPEGAVFMVSKVGKPVSRKQREEGVGEFTAMEKGVNTVLLIVRDEYGL